VTTLFHKLMSFQRVFSGECLATSTIAQKWFFAAVRFTMPFQIVLTIKRQRAHVT
jgi:hypothetical protein